MLLTSLTISLDIFELPVSTSQTDDVIGVLEELRFDIDLCRTRV